MLEEGFLKVSNIHTIYYNTYGNKNGIPIIFLHGGPGGSSNIQKYIERIDLNKFYCISYDQRGCGKSIPNGELKENSTQDLIEDIIKLMNYLNIEKAIFSASSWGSCLSLLFAILHANRVEKMFLGSTFLARKIDSDWLYRGSKIIFPDLYERFMNPIIPDKIENIPKYLLEKIENSTFKEQQRMACLMSNYEYSLMSMTFSSLSFRKIENLKKENINSIKIFLHFESNNYFIEDNYIIDNINNIKNIPINFYHGRFDMDCILDGVYELHKKLQNSKLIIIPYEGHIGVLLDELKFNDINNLTPTSLFY